MENGLIKDDQITASSQHDEESVGPKRARIRTDIEGGAFCPKEMINRDQNYEFLSIDLKKVFVISAIELQGRYANGSGREFTPYFKIEYLRKNSSWIRYKSRSKKTIFVGNTDTFTPVYISLDPPIVASKVRIVPWSNSSRK
uniref:F5/8 type C domain-containing protein n=1 Tax=Rhabditophanes sp. KR3021 TaxID=114890 RepID=A0AC35UBP7_9BILA